MTAIFLDGFDHYGVGDFYSRLRMLDGVWAEINLGGGGDVAIVEPSFGTRTGVGCLRMTYNTSNTEGLVRKVLPATQTDFILGFGIYLPELPANTGRRIEFRDNTNATLFSLGYNSDGSLTLCEGEDGATIISSQGPVLTAGTWHHLEMHITVSDSAGVFNVVLDGSTEVIDGTGLDFGTTTAVAQFAFRQPTFNGNGDQCEVHYDDLFIKDTNGSVNNGFSGDVRIATLVPDSDEALNWTPRYRLNIGEGVLDLREDDAVLSAADSADFEFGTGDYTIEGFVRFHATSTGTRQIIGKWQTGSSQREWALELTGSGDPNPGQLRFLISTDGEAETVIHTWPFDPLLFKWYHFAVVRDGTDSYLFLDGQILGVVRADANDYFAGTAALGIGGRMSSASAVVADSAVGGMMDEIRITSGVARYTSNFTPTTVPFGRDVGDDADFASVVLLAGFDAATLTDESNAARTLTARNDAAALLPDDGDGGYTVLNQYTPRDDTVLDARLIPAFGVLTATVNPTNTETVTIGSTVYTFVDTVSSAYDVHIGADLAESLDNLAAAINDSGTEGTDYGTGTDAHPTVTALRLPDPQVMVTAITPGTSGNSIATTDTLANGSWGDTTLDGGVSIPSASDFGLSRLPDQTTLVRAIQVVTRAFKSDAGTATIRPSFVGPQGAADAGSDQVLTTDPTYRWSIFEVDPDTDGPITPVTISNGRVRINRES